MSRILIHSVQQEDYCWWHKGRTDASTICYQISLNDCKELTTATMTATRHRVLANISRSCYNTLQYGRNGMVHAAGASILSLARGVFAGIRSACGMWWAWRITAGLRHAFP